MNLRNFLKYVLFRDTTFKGEFRALQRLAGPDCPRIIVDVGANDGFYASNSFPFVARGWRAILIEPHPGAFRKLQKLHAGKERAVCLNIACADAAGERPLYFGINSPGGSRSTLSTDDRFSRVRSKEFTVVRVERLDTVLAQQAVPHDFGILSIDAEGLDYEVLLGLNLDQWRPRVIITEDFKPTDEPKQEYLRGHGYRHAAQCPENALWVREREVAR